MAARRDGLPDRRRGESIVERECRNEGVEVYMPSFWVMLQHQRTNKLVEKRAPFLVGYAFVNIPESGFEKVRTLDGVLCFVRGSNGPIAFKEEDLGVLILAEDERKRAYDAERNEKQAKSRQYRRNALNKSLGLVFPKGRRKKIPLRMLAEAEIDSLGAASRQRVLDIINELKALDNEEAACKSQPEQLISAA